MPKFVFVTGGVMSGIGKGVTTASIGKLCQFRGFKVSALKIDPYLNVDPGTLNPVEHGECFITDQVWKYNPIGDTTNNPFTSTKIAELDQDFGTYERFLGDPIHPSHNITSGQIYFETILKERKGDYLGKTVQIIPHCTNMIKERIQNIAKDENLDVLIIECGGTVGDVESVIFLEAFRQLRLELPEEDTALVHVTLVPYSKAVGELKSKPTQHSVKELQSAGLQPDFLICRSEINMYEAIKAKISLFSNVKKEHVIANPDLKSIYQLPLIFEQQGFGDLLGENLDLKTRLVENNTYSEWVEMTNLFVNKYTKTLRIAMPGKYVDNKDSYVSINHALAHSCAHEKVNLEIVFVDTEKDNFDDDLNSCDGILLTPGFGTRGVEGMIHSAEFAMDNKIPYLGICFGAQLFYVAFMRSRMGIESAQSTEIDPNAIEPVVSMMDEQQKIVNIGGTMRLGGHSIIIDKDTKLYEAYQQTKITERFRHRYHINEKYATAEAKNKGIRISAYDETRKIVNAIELTGDHWMVGVQCHPEYTSRPFKPSPIYHAFIKAILKNKA
ncbi:CTP synthase [Candidatus Lokiarchaeum ossiferum]|uniref:CTP synthase (glutamine hydrolyzing) n=1 Tax=Candidatus Lokiarchaeum ossiferum TaxID=2951803 RepID=A0ABY6HQA9_9ARCH|nr:CTP synthase [Candidatus Lokiarchaeum sp. B-35]